MTDEAQKIIAALRAECGDQTCGECPSWEWCHGDRQDKLDDDAADLIEKLSADLEAAKECEKRLLIMLTSAQSAAETYKRERDQYWDYIKGMECESCSGNCDNCTVTRDGFTGWEWSGDKCHETAICDSKEET